MQQTMIKEEDGPVKITLIGTLLGDKELHLNVLYSSCIIHRTIKFYLRWSCFPNHKTQLHLDS